MGVVKRSIFSCWPAGEAVLRSWRVWYCILSLTARIPCSAFVFSLAAYTTTARVCYRDSYRLRIEGVFVRLSMVNDIFCDLRDISQIIHNPPSRERKESSVSILKISHNCIVFPNNSSIRKNNRTVCKSNPQGLITSIIFSCQTPSILN